MEFYKKPIFWILLFVVAVLIVFRDEIFGVKKMCGGGLTYPSVDDLNQEKMHGGGRIGGWGWRGGCATCGGSSSYIVVPPVPAEEVVAGTGNFTIEALSDDLSKTTREVIIKLQRKLKLIETGAYDQATKDAFENKLHKFIDADRGNFAKLLSCAKNEDIDFVIDCLIGYGII